MRSTVRFVVRFRVLVALLAPLTRQAFHEAGLVWLHLVGPACAVAFFIVPVVRHYSCWRGWR